VNNYYSSTAYLFSALPTTFGTLSWVHSQDLRPTDGGGRVDREAAIDLQGGRAIVGTPIATCCSRPGAAYLFDVGSRLRTYLYSNPYPAITGDPFAWVMDFPARAQLDATFGVFALTTDGRAQLLNRRALQRVTGSAAARNAGRETMSVYSMPAYPKGLPSTIALILVMFDNANGEQLLLRTEAVGEGSPGTAAQRKQLGKQVERFTRYLTLERLNALDVGVLENLARSGRRP
jgi:hypothetical protein